MAARNLTKYTDKQIHKMFIYACKKRDFPFQIIVDLTEESIKRTDKWIETMKEKIRLKNAAASSNNIEVNDELKKSGFIYRDPDPTKMTDLELKKFESTKKICENEWIFKPTIEAASSNPEHIVHG